MGCTESTPADGKAKKAGRKSSTAPMTKMEIHKRIDSIEQTCEKKFGGVSVRYAYLSQRGYYPDDAHKPNQDSYAVLHDFAGRDTDAFFGVFDGHGRDGDKCAHFVRDNLGNLVSRTVERVRRESGEVESKEKLQDILSKAHLECNRRMHRDAKVDDSLSGTTSISVYLQGNRNRITISNVGDSRAVIGRAADPAANANGSDAPSSSVAAAGGGTGAALKAFALSRDQTPYRRDERVRIRRTGARILSLDQIEGLEPVDEGEAARDEELHLNGNASGDGEIILGEEIDEGGDPPRVWSPHGDYPGTAFTRSLGDAVAEELGVTAEPEMLTRELAPEDKIIVLASDGVFEFLTNQSVVDICAKFADPLEACRAVVAESYELWLQYELRTDDITMICIFVDGVDEDRSTIARSTVGGRSIVGSITADGLDDGEEREDDDLVETAMRPVRTNMSVEKSRALLKTRKAQSLRDVSDMNEEDFDIESLYNEKTEEQKSRIAEAIRASVVFQNITDAQRELIYKVMEPMEVKAGQWIIKQGTVGDRFYIVDEGSFEVRILPEGQEDEAGDGGNKVHVYEGSCEDHRHPSFGELALMYSAPRAASIIAQTDGHLWALHRYAFKKITGETEGRKTAEKVLKKIDVFKSFTVEELKELSSYLCEAKFGKGDTIIKEGEVGNSLFIIVPGGNCESVRVGEDGTKTTTMLAGDDFFGEEILKGGGEKQYLSTVTATAKTTFWTLQKSDVKRVMGSRWKSSKNMAA